MWRILKVKEVEGPTTSGSIKNFNKRRFGLRHSSHGSLLAVTDKGLGMLFLGYNSVRSCPSFSLFNPYLCIYIWRYSGLWHKVLNAVVAELSRHKVGKSKMTH